MIRGMLPAQRVVACLKFDAFCKMHRRRVCSLLRAKREPENAPATFEAREARTRGCTPSSNPKEDGLHTKNPSRSAKGFFVFRRFQGPSAAAAAAPRRGAGALVSFVLEPVTLPPSPLPVKSESRKIRRFSGFLSIKIIVPLKMPRAKRRAF